MGRSLDSWLTYKVSRDIMAYISTISWLISTRQD